MDVTIIEKGTVYHSEKTFSYSAWPTVTKLSDGTISVVFSGNRAWHVCPFGRLLMSKSTDNGATWTQPQTVIDTLLDDRDGGICVFGENKDKVFVSSFTNTPDMQSELLKNEGMRIAFPAITDELVALNDSYYNYLFSRFDKKEVENSYLGGIYKISYDNGATFTDFGVLPISAPHGPTATKDGKLLFVGRALTDKEYYGSIKSPGKGFWLYESIDGKEWAEPKLVLPLTDEENNFYSEAHVLVTESNRILVQIRGNEPDKHGTYQTYSDDGGNTFTPLQLVAEKGFPSHLLKLKDNTILMSYGYRFDDMGIRMKLSADDGATWSDEIVLLSGAGNADLGYPSTVELEDGTFLTTYYQIEAGNKNAGIYYLKWRLNK